VDTQARALTPNATSPDKLWYDTEGTDQVKFSPENLGLARKYFDTYSGLLERHFAGRKDVRALELGAGSCSLSALVCRLPFIESVTCQDISLRKMQTLAPQVFEMAGTDIAKATFDQGDFGQGLPFQDSSFDLILFDAALHHTRNMWLTLADCRRVLTRGGMLVAQREQYLGAWTANAKIRKLLNEDDVKAGVSENAFLRCQYDYYLRVSGFEPRFIPVSENGLQSLLRPLNGKLLSKWVICATPV
jgi:ubiquinone/menaquinone biosynthesis C-methylase UbiE